MSSTPQASGEAKVQVGHTYRDKRGREWEVLSFLYREGYWFVRADDERGGYLHAFDRRANRGKFVRVTAFAKSLASEST